MDAAGNAFNLGCQLLQGVASGFGAGGRACRRMHCSVQSHWGSRHCFGCCGWLTGYRWGGMLGAGEDMALRSWKSW